MNLRSVLCAATLLAAAGVAQAFPEYENLDPEAGSTVTINSESPANTFFAVQYDFYFDWDYSVTIVDKTAATLYNETTGLSLNSNNAMYTGGVAFGFDTEKIKEFGAGTYTLTIPAGSYTITSKTGEDAQPAEDLDNAPNPTDITATYTIVIDEGGNNEEQKKWEKIDFVSIDPAAGSKLLKWGGDGVSRVDVKTSDDDAVNTIVWEIWNKTTGEYVQDGKEYRIDLNRNGHTEDVWTEGLYFTVGGEGQWMVEGNTYELTMTFAGIGYNPDNNQYPSPEDIADSKELTTTVTYEGAKEAPKYSAVEYVSVTPNPETYEIDDPNLAFFDIEYSAPAKPIEFSYSMGMMGTGSAGTWAPYEGMEEDENGLCTKWTFTFSPSLIADATGTIFTTVISMGGDGLYVRGNGETLFDNIRYSMSWDCNVGAPALVSVSPKPYTYMQSLSSITVTNEKNGMAYVMSPSWLTAEKPRIVTRQGAEIRVLGEPEYAEDQLSATWNFEPITESGNYILIIPKQYFNFGEDTEGYVSNQATFEYFVDKAPEATLLPSEITPANGSELEEIKIITLTFDEAAYVPFDIDFSATLYRIVDGEEILVEEADPIDNPESDYYNPTMYDFYFNALEAGEYKLVIPEGMFVDSVYDNTMGRTGAYNPGLVYNYTIVELPPIEYDLMPTNITPANDANVTALDVITLTFGETAYVAQVETGDFAVSFAKAEVYRQTEAGDVLVAEVVPFDNPESNYMNPTIYDIDIEKALEEAITEEGNYIVALPKGAFVNQRCVDSYFRTGKATPQIVLAYVVSNGSGVAAILDGAESVNVYDVNGVQILKDANVEAAKELKAGMYIINGKKVMIRK